MRKGGRKSDLNRAVCQRVPGHSQLMHGHQALPLQGPHHRHGSRPQLFSYLGHRERLPVPSQRLQHRPLLASTAPRRVVQVTLTPGEGQRDLVLESRAGSGPLKPGHLDYETFMDQQPKPGLRRGAKGAPELLQLKGRSPGLQVP